VNGTSDFRENILIQVINAVIVMYRLGNLRQDLGLPNFMFIMWEYIPEVVSHSKILSQAMGLRRCSIHQV